jgi:hypothetical protein
MPKKSLLPPTVIPKNDPAATVKNDPPKHNASGSTKKSVATSAGNATVVSEGSISQGDLSTLQKYASSGPVSNIYYNDTTGSYPTLGDTIKDYLKNKLLWSTSDLSYMYELRIVDCPDCNYSGLYTGSYLTDSGGKINKAFGWITLNVSPYKTSPDFVDYMKLTFSHEYGHHYTLYHRWVDDNIPAGQRWEASYYSTRPLSLATTAPDYSLGWGNCDTEIMAEDYSYIFSGYGYHAMSATYGYPSSEMRNWLLAMSSIEAPVQDTVAPMVAISSPANGATVSGIVNVAASASDNVGVTRVEIYIDGTKSTTLMTSPYSYAWETRSYANGSHSIEAKAYDSNQSADTTINVIIDNNASDTEKPVVTISDPSSSPVSWTTGDLHILASATDNVAVVKIEIYINDTLVATENSSSIERSWLSRGTPAGSYNMTFKAYDSAGNIGTASVVVNKS